MLNTFFPSVPGLGCWHKLACLMVNVLRATNSFSERYRFVTSAFSVQVRILTVVYDHRKQLQVNLSSGLLKPAGLSMEISGLHPASQLVRI